MVALIPPPGFTTPDFATAEALLHTVRNLPLAGAAVAIPAGHPLQVLLAWAQACQRAGKLAEARDAMAAALAFSGNAPVVWRDLGRIHMALEDDRAAEYCVRRALRAEPTLLHGWGTLGAVLLRRGDMVAACQAYRQETINHPNIAQAQQALGVLCADQKDFPAAIPALQAFVALAPGDQSGWTALGYCLMQTGDFGDAADAYDRAAALGALDPKSRQRQLRGRTLQIMIDQGVDVALSAYPALAGADADDEKTLLRIAFEHLNSHGHVQAARDVGARRLAIDPDNRIQRYLLDVLSDQAPSAAPPDCVEYLFDRFAPSFDTQLVDRLGYRVPDHLAAMVAAHRPHCASVLDLGCGTGLAAPHLQLLGGTLAGVDLSGKMLDRARDRGLYQTLAKAEAVAYLQQHPAEFDLIFAADVLVYLGDLAALFAAAWAALRPAGLFAFSVEAHAGDHYTVRPSGRFAHSVAYLNRLAAPGFTVLAQAPTTIRMEAHKPVAGTLTVLERQT